MEKKERNKLSKAGASLFLVISLSLYLMEFHGSNYYVYGGIILSTFLVDVLLYNLLSDRSANKRRKPISDPNRLRSDEEILTNSFYDLSRKEFERLCFLYYKSKGFNPRVATENIQNGVDLIVSNPEHKADEAIQIKHIIDSENQITIKEISELHSSKKNHGCMFAQMITTSSYTNEALSKAYKLNIECHDLHWVVSEIVKWQREEAMKKLLKLKF